MSTAPNRLIFDIEIARPIPIENGQPQWRRAKECGVSVFGAWGVNDIAPTVLLFDWTRLPGARPTITFASERFRKADGAASWNGIEFDEPVLRADPATQRCLGSIGGRHVDLMALCCLGSKGVDLTRPDVVDMASGWAKLAPDRNSLFKGWRLDAVAKETLGVGKAEDMAGADAPVFWQNGRYSEVITYCLRDVAVTRLLYLHAWNEGWLASPERGRVEIPQEAL